MRDGEELLRALAVGMELGGGGYLHIKRGRAHQPWGMDVKRKEREGRNQGNLGPELGTQIEGLPFLEAGS